MSALAARDRRALTIGAVAVAALLGWGLLMRPLLAHRALARAELASQRELLWRERALIREGPRPPADERTARVALGRARARLAPGDSVSGTAALGELVGELARASGVEVATLEGLPAASDGALVRLSVEARGTGEWSRILQLTRALEESSRLLHAGGLSLERGAAAPPGASSAVSYTLVVSGWAPGETP